MLTNSQVINLNTPDRLLTEIDRQRRYLIRVWGVKKSCPCCGHKLNLFEARGEELDEHDFVKTEKKPMNCTKCHRQLREVLPFMGEWFWEAIND